MNPKFISDLKATPSTGVSIRKVSYSGTSKESAFSKEAFNSARCCHLLKLKLERPLCKPAVSSQRIIFRTNLPQICGSDQTCAIVSCRSEGMLLPKWMLDSDIDLDAGFLDGDQCPRNLNIFKKEDLVGKFDFSSRKLKSFMEFSELRMVQEKASLTKESHEKGNSELTMRWIEFNYSSFRKVVIPPRIKRTKLKPALKRDDDNYKASQEMISSKKRSQGSTTPKVSFSSQCMVMHYFPDSFSKSSPPI